ncbi:hypothetical protein [Eubacterium aggregans]
MRRYETALTDVADKLPQLEVGYKAAVVKRETCAEIIAGLGIEAQQNEV